MWIHWKSFHKRWTQLGASSCSKYQGYSNGQNRQNTQKFLPLGIYIGGLMEGVARQKMNQINGTALGYYYRRWWSQGEIQSKEGQARGVEWVCTFKPDQGRRRQGKVTEPALCLPQAEVQRAWGQQEQREDRSNEDRLWVSNCEHFGIYCDFRRRYAGEEFGPRKFRIVVYQYGLIIRCILPFL